MMPGPVQGSTSGTRLSKKELNNILKKCLYKFINIKFYKRKTCISICKSANII